jgi:uncharacterized protein
MPNPVTQFQIVAPNPDATARFYSKVFGWSVDAGNPMGYRTIAADAGGIAGGIWPAPPGAPSLTQLFIAVDDIERVVQDAQQLGARLLIPISTLPEGDRMAVLHDPDGMPFAVMAKNASSAPAPR